MSVSQCIIALGANLGNRQENFERVVELIGEKVGEVSKRSTWIESEPLAPQVSDCSVGAIHESPVPAPAGTYLNGVILVETILQPKEVLDILHEIEAVIGRQREEEMARWQSRIIDLDIIAFDDLVIETEDLTLPHPEMHKREFVLKPMLEVCPKWVHPVMGKGVAELLLAL